MAVGPTQTVSDEELAQLGSRGYFTRDGFVGRAAALEVREAIEALPAKRFHLGGMMRAGNNKEPTLRGDELTWLRQGEPAHASLGALIPGFETLRRSLSARAHLGELDDYIEMQVARYPGKGARYAPHLDSFPDGKINRRVTAIVYLNSDWKAEDGGALRIHVEGGHVELLPELDRLVVFMSDRMVHEVLPSFAMRWAVTCWYYDKMNLG